ncbi:S41 family peptidase [Streptacidiphilus sp. 4-A2]|nr:S41 family peptidase [Streptacidiphilus sp. 4-A2]
MILSATETIEATLRHITIGYVFPDHAAEVEAAVRQHLADGAYDGLTGPALCAAVTGHMQAISNDKHLRLLWNDEPAELDADPDADDTAYFADLCRRHNYGVACVRVLEGGVGYIDLDLIGLAEPGQRVFAAAMEIVAGTKALIIDTRRNRGGSPDGVALWCSFLFPDGETHLNDIYVRRTDTTRQYWTSAHVPGPRYLDRPVYLLTSSTTFSGGEDLAYNLQAQGRATLIGETTRGGAHPTEYYRIDPHLTVTVPTARAINPVTGTNWEGVGVVPDIAVTADEALDTALALAADAPEPALTR